MSAANPYPSSVPPPGPPVVQLTGADLWQRLDAHEQRIAGLEARPAPLRNGEARVNHHDEDIRTLQRELGDMKTRLIEHLAATQGARAQEDDDQERRRDQRGLVFGVLASLAALSTVMSGVLAIVLATR